MRKALIGFLFLACGGPTQQDDPAPSLEITQTSDVLPSIKTSLPGNGDSEVAVSSMITIVFGSAMDSRTIDASTIYFSDGTPGMVAWRGGRTVTLLPKGGLQFATTYTVVVAAKVASEDGVAFGRDKTFSFTTAAAPVKTVPVKMVPDTSPPTLTSSVPPADAVDVALATTVTLTFSEPLQAATVSPQSVKLLRDGATIATTVSVQGSVITLTPSAALAYGATYQVAVSTVVTDVAGNAVSALTRSFSTLPPPDETPPEIEEVVPMNAATDVEVTAHIVLTFSEPIAPGTGVVALEDGAHAAVAFSLDYSGNTLTVVPAAPLAAGTAYVLTVTGVTDVAQNPLSGAYLLSFTTKL